MDGRKLLTLRLGSILARGIVVLTEFVPPPDLRGICDA